MRYFTYVEPMDPPHNNDPMFVTVSEEQIREEYYPYWREQTRKTRGDDYLYSYGNFGNCLEDWTIVHWAWETDICGNDIR